MEDTTLSCSCLGRIQAGPTVSMTHDQVKEVLTYSPEEPSTANIADMRMITQFLMEELA